jgi:hypothetical protein
LFKACTSTTFNNSYLIGKYVVKIYSSASELPEEWNVICKQQLHLNSKLLMALESAKLSDLEFCYIMVKTDDLVVAVFYFQILSLRKYHYKDFQTSRNRILKHIEQIILDKNNKIWVCGNLFKTDFKGFIVNEEVRNTSEIVTVIKDFFKNRIIKEKPNLLLFKDVPLNDRLNNDFKRLKFKHTKDDIVLKMDIPIEWKSIEEYKLLLSKKYLARFNKIHKELSPLIREELSLKEIEKYGDTIISLYNQVLNRQSIRLGILNINYFINCKKYYNSSFKFYGYFLEGTLVGFTSNFINNGEWEIHYIGFDYEINQKHKLFLNFLFNGLNDAIINRSNRLNLGRTAREAKVSLGAQPVYYSNYFKLRGATTKVLFNFLESKFKESEGDDWKVRNPFKVKKSDITN